MLKLAFCISLIIISASSSSGAGGIQYKEYRYDSLLPQSEFKSDHFALILDLLDAETDYQISGNNKKALLHLLKISRLKKAIRNRTVSSRLYFDLARVSARLQLYPQAMKYFYRTVLGSHSPAWALEYGDSSLANDSFDAGTDSLHMVGPQFITRSEPVSGEEVRRSFEDGRKADSYAILLHVKQPRPGKRKAFTGINNVGHMFITLIKYNCDNSIVSRSFGFYPHKSWILSATPLYPGAGPVFKDDARHDWDEAVGKFISRKKFDKILTELNRFNHLPYNLNQNNCTDFGLSVAIAAGINIPDTRGSWPLGSGNNPANAGQSLLEGRYGNCDEQHPETLFLNRNLKDISQ